MELFGLDINSLISTILGLGLAFVFAFSSAWEREQATRIMGIRTYPLVAMESCAY